MLYQPRIILVGSSPQVRGTRFLMADFSFPLRFIPAGAGNTLEKTTLIERKNGSSPQVRGTHGNLRFEYVASRFIPAGAGNTELINDSPVTRPVHPRRCGEHLHKVFAVLGLNGSSPQVRGTQAVKVGNRNDTRFIPAGAGNTSPVNSTVCLVSVHPRRCGEHHCFVSLAISARGSSPQVRGTLSDSRPRIIILRFIPAGAGNTEEVPSVQSP